MVYGYTPSSDPGLRKIAKQFSGKKKSSKKKKTPSRGSGANPVSRMGLGSIYDKIVLDDTSTGPSRPAAPTGRGGGGGVRRYVGGGGGGVAYRGPSAAEIAAQQAAIAAAYRKQILDTYIAPVNKLYDTAVEAAESDKIRGRQAYDRARADVTAYTGNTNRQAGYAENARQKAYADAARRMGLGAERGLTQGIRNGQVTAQTKKVLDRNWAFNKTVDTSNATMYRAQRENEVGRVQGYQDELRRQQKLQRAAIAQKYGVKL